MPKSITGNQSLTTDKNSYHQPTDEPNEGITSNRKSVKPQTVNNPLLKGTKSELFTKMTSKDIAGLGVITQTSDDGPDILERDGDNDFVVVDTVDRGFVEIDNKSITTDDRLKGFVDAQDKLSTFNKAYDDLIESGYSEDEAKKYANEMDNFSEKGAFQMRISDLCNKKNQL